MRRIIVWVIGLYRNLVSPFLGSSCRFYPSCSEYAQTAVTRYGVFKGGWMSVRRISRCHPWHEGGLDPVPEKKE